MRAVADGAAAEGSHGMVTRWSRRLAVPILIGAALGWTTRAAEAQSQRYGGARRAEIHDDRFRTVGLEFALRVFGASPSGVAFDFPAGTQDVDYSDIFGTGVGAGVAGYVPFVVREAGDRPLEVAIGPLLAIDQVTYPGQRDTDAFGDSLEPDDLRVARVLAGFHARWRVGRADWPVRFLAGAQIGLGVAFIDEVPATLDLSGSGLGVFQGTLYDSTTTVAFELSVRVGLSIRLAPAVDLGVTATFGIEAFGPPENADGPGNPIGPADAEANVAGLFGLAVSVTIRFGR